MNNDSVNRDQKQEEQSNHRKNPVGKLPHRHLSLKEMSLVKGVAGHSKDTCLCCR